MLTSFLKQLNNLQDNERAYKVDQSVIYLYFSNQVYLYYNKYNTWIVNLFYLYLVRTLRWLHARSLFDNVCLQGAFLSALLSFLGFQTHLLLFKRKYRKNAQKWVSFHFFFFFYLYISYCYLIKISETLY